MADILVSPAADNGEIFSGYQGGRAQAWISPLIGYQFYHTGNRAAGYYVKTNDGGLTWSEHVKINDGLFCF